MGLMPISIHDHFQLEVAVTGYGFHHVQVALLVEQIYLNRQKKKKKKDIILPFRFFMLRCMYEYSWKSLCVERGDKRSQRA